MKKIAAYGCSFVQGTGLDPKDESAALPHPKSWPYLIGKNLNVSDVMNRGFGGGSNKFSIIRLLTDIINQDFSNTLVIFSWTSILRTAFFNNKKHIWETIMLGSPFEDKELENAYQYYYGKIHTDYEAAYERLQQQLFLQLFLKEKNIQHVFINGIPPTAGIRDVEKDIFLYGLENMIDRDNYVLGYDNSIQDQISKFDLKCYDNYHPNEQGHIFIADLVTQFIKEKYA